MSRKRIALVLPWAGELPRYWAAWQNSAKDRCFDVVIIRRSLEEFSGLIQDKLFHSTVPLGASPFPLATGHKLCDFKPMYGILFAEELKDYDYWAFGDCDVMYGRQFDAWIEKVVAGDYEVATVQQDFVAGPFTLVRNCEKCNRLYARTEGWREILAQSRTMAFDELGENWFRKWLGGHRSYEQLRTEQESFSAVCWREREAGRLRFLNEQVICEDRLNRGEKAEYRTDGSLMVRGREVAIYHFMSAKMSFGFTGDDHSVWVSRGGPFVRDVVGFVAAWLRGNPSARRRVEEWVQRRRGDPNWWKDPAWNNLDR